jgi:HD-like signal output (HDOD) protein
MLQRADEKISKLFRGLADVPSLGEVVEKLLLLSEKDATARQFADIIAVDQGLASKILRLVNSAFYALRTPISSIRQASSLLGTKTLKSLALSVSVIHLFTRRCAGFDPLCFWRHSVATAVLSQKFGAIFWPGTEEDLYAAGLLHDVGVALLVQYLSGDYELVLKLQAASKRPLCDVETEVLGTHHAEVGWTLAHHWRLPPVIVDAIRHHEDAPGSAKGVPPETLEKVDVVRLADRSSQVEGFAYVEESAWSAPPRMAPWMAPHEAELQRAIAEIPAEMKEREKILEAVGETRTPSSALLARALDPA